MTMNLKNLYQNEYSFEETINENSFRIESFSHLSIRQTISKSNDENVKPKELYLITQQEANENGNVENDTLFADKINQIACYNTNLGWIFYQPKIGDIAYIRSFGGFYYFNGANWVVMTTASGGSSGSPATMPTYSDDNGNQSTEKVVVENPFFLGFKMSCRELPNNASWLKSDAELKDGVIYRTMYNKILDAFSNGEEKPATISGTTYLTKEKDGLVVVSKEDWLSIYNTLGNCNFYGIDEENQQFYLPYNQEANRVLIEKKEATDENQTWYNLYSDGWVEQGGQVAGTTGSGGVFDRTASLPFQMKTDKYNISANAYRNNDFVSYDALYCGISIFSTSTNIHFRTAGANSYQYIDGVIWEARGYTNQTQGISVKCYDYYYVGAVIENNSQINITQLSSKILELENRIAELENA